LPAIPTDPILLAGSITTNGHASGTGAHHDPRPLSEGSGQRDLDIGGHYYLGYQILGAKRCAQFIALWCSAGTRCANQENISGQASGSR
jgi:hypothetical protein